MEILASPMAVRDGMGRVTIHVMAGTTWRLVRKRTVPTERPQLVGVVSANLCGLWVSRDQRNGSPRLLVRCWRG
jgi:hypothetical protein